MKPHLLFLPFVAILIGALGTAFGSAFPGFKWAAEIAWALAAGVFALWIVLDIENFKALFQRKGAKYGAASGAVVLLGVLVIVGVGVLTSRPRFNKSVDLTRDGLNTLSDQSMKLIEQSKSGEPIKVVAFAAEEAVSKQIKDLVDLYEKAGANFTFEVVDPQSDPTRAMGEKVEGNTLILRRGAQEKRITTFNEEKLSNALVNVMKDKTKKIYFTKGHGEGALKGAEATGFNTIVTELENNKNTVEELSLLESAKVPDDADMVVVAGPKYDFKEEETRILEDYLLRGGAVLVMANAMTPAETLNKMLGKFGIAMKSDLLILAPNDQLSQIYGQNNAFVTEFDEFSPVTKDFATQSAVALRFSFTRSLEEVPDNAHKLKVELVAKTSKQMIRVKQVAQPSDLENLSEDKWEMGAFPVIAVAHGKLEKAPATAAADKKGGDTATDAAQGTTESQQQKEIRLVTVGSAEFANNGGAQYAEHRDMFVNMTNYLLQDEDFISIRPKDPTKSTIDISSPRSQLLLLVLAFIYPFFFLGAGTFVWLKRRRA